MIVCIGDSITYGQHLEDPAKAWPRLLNGDVLSFGVPGDTTRLGLERFPEQVQKLFPEIVIIQFGHNDANRWETDRGLPRVSPYAYKANLTEMVQRARKFGAVPMLCSITPSHRSKAHARSVSNYNVILRRVADVNKVPLIDVRVAFAGGQDLLMEDGLHLSEKGHEVYAATVQEALDRR